MSKPLVVVLGETRAHELTYDSFKKNTPIKIGKINEIDSKLNNL